MTEDLTQAEADTLLKIEERRADEERRRLPGQGAKLTAPLVSLDKREEFLLDISRSRLNLQKVTHQTRARVVIVLARLDLGGAPHRNPDDVEIGVPHLHLYREGYGDKSAFAVPDAAFRDLSDRWTTLHDFMQYCRVVEPPHFERSLDA